jgi:hypothetical protein
MQLEKVLQTTNRHEINLGEHRLIVLDDQSIELMQHQSEQASYALHLESSEVYLLMRCLQDLYKPVEM